jgi:hypothetical protein
MSVAPPAADVGPIVRLAFARAEALAGGDGREGDGREGRGREGGGHSRRAGSHRHAPEPAGRFHRCHRHP